MNQTFGKEYKLCSKKTIEFLFEKKKTVKQFPFIATYGEIELPTKKSFQVVISAPKRIFRKAHDRNRIKRLMREVFRKKKLILEDFLLAEKRQIALFLVYTNKEEMKYTVLENKIELLFTKLVSELRKDKKIDKIVL
jgi:ribonuclease P protein component